MMADQKHDGQIMVVYRPRVRGGRRGGTLQVRHDPRLRQPRTPPELKTLEPES